MRLTARQLAELADDVHTACTRWRELGWRMEDERLDEVEIVDAIGQAWGALADLHEVIERRRGVRLPDQV